MPNSTLKKLIPYHFVFLLFLFLLSVKTEAQTNFTGKVTFTPLNNTIEEPIQISYTFNDTYEKTFNASTIASDISQVCNGEMKVILKDDFGSGTSDRGSKPSFTNFTTSYNFSPSGRIPPNSYSIMKDPSQANISWSAGGDHTTGKNGDGYMLVFDANSIAGSVFYEKKYSDLCAGGFCTFSIYASNMVSTSIPGFSVKPKIKIDLINPRDGTVLKTMTSNELQLSQQDTLLWNELTLSFNIPAGLDNVIVRVSNAQTDPNINGNDVAFDDASFSICVPKVTISKSNEVCSGQNTTLTAVNENTTNAYNYQWQELNGTNWTDISGAIAKDYTTPLLTEAKNYRIRCAESGINITSNNNLICSGSKEILVDVMPKPADIITTYTICSGESYTWSANNTTYTTSQTGLRINNNGCTADQVLNLIVIPKPGDIVTTYTICSGESYTWAANNTTYTTSQTGLRINNNGCTADQVLNLIVIPKPADIVTTYTICSGESYTWAANNTTYTTSQTGLRINNNGCTANQVLNLIVIPKPADIVTTYTICSGESYTWAANNTAYTTSQTGLRINNNGCTADQILNLTVIPKPADIVTTYTICSGESYTWAANNTAYTTSQNGLRINNNGCTADQVLNLTVIQKPADIVTIYTICSGETYTWAANNTAYTTSQNGLRINNNGCTADQVLNLTVGTKPTTVVTNQNICFGESYTWDVTGTTYTTAGTYTQNNNGCTADQVLNLTIGTKPTTVVTNENICFGESYIWDVTGITYATAGTYTQNNNGCTADQVLNLTIGTKPTTVVTNENICFGESYTWDVTGITYTTTGTYTQNNNGCTADQVLNLTIGTKPTTVVTNQNICFGESYIWDVTGTTYTTAGTYTQNNNGCTADQVLNLTIGTKPTTVVTNENICFGESYIWDVTGITYATAGTYTQNNNGCTADQVLNLTIGTKPTTVVTNESICFGESYTWDVTGITYATAGTYTQNNNGCTAAQVLNLTVGIKPSDIVTTKSICAEESYKWIDNITYTTSQTGLRISNDGCTADQVLNLTVALPLSSSIVANSVLPEYCFEDNTGAFSIEISGGIAPYRVSLNNSNGIYEEVTGTEHSFSNISGSRQIVYIKDALDCTFDLPVIMPEAIVLNPVATVSYGCSVNSVTIAIDPSTNFLDVDYALDNGNYQTDNLFTNLSAGLHTITARHTNGCIQSTKAFIIKHVEPLKLSLTDGEMNEIVANATSGAGEYQYSFEGQSYNNENKFIIYKSGNYNVTVKDKNGCSTTVTKYFTYIDVCIPNYFTPNGDGVYDEWGPDCTVNYRSLIYTIIDRYGREIANYHYGQKWDGKYNGKELPSGDYWYVLKLNDPNDPREFVGHFTLYR